MRFVLKYFSKKKKIKVLNAGHYLDIFYPWSAINTEIIGQFIAKGLEKMVTDYPLKNFHLIGKI